LPYSFAWLESQLAKERFLILTFLYEGDFLFRPEKANAKLSEGQAKRKTAENESRMTCTSLLLFWSSLCSALQNVLIDV
jgi:hypothetical protein